MRQAAKPSSSGLCHVRFFTYLSAANQDKQKSFLRHYDNFRWQRYGILFETQNYLYVFYMKMKNLCEYHTVEVKGTTAYAWI